MGDLEVGDLEVGDVEVGDVVILKSGGEAMTVGEVSATGWVVCVWFSEAKVRRHVFKPEMLQLLDLDEETQEADGG